MAALVLFPLVVCLALAVSTAYARTPILCRFSGLMAAATVAVSGIALSAAVLNGSTPTAGGLLRVDALSAFMLTVVGAVGLTATWGGLPTRKAPATTWTYSTLVTLFLGAMSLAVLADNLGVLWVAVEATTIATAFLVGHNGTPSLPGGGLEVRRPGLGRGRDRLPRTGPALRGDRGRRPAHALLDRS